MDRIRRESIGREKWERGVGEGKGVGGWQVKERGKAAFAIIRPTPSITVWIRPWLVLDARVISNNIKKVS